MKYIFPAAAIIACCSCGTPAAQKTPVDSLVIADKAAMANDTFATAAADTVSLGGVVYDITAITKEEFDAVKGWEIDTSESRSLQQTGGAVRRVGDTLFFQAANRRVMMISDRDADEGNNPGEEFVEYSYYGEVPGSGHWLVGCMFYESYAYALIGKETGDTTFTIGVPVISPDGKYFVAGNADLEAQFTPNGLELYRNGKKPQLVDERMLEYWGPNTVKWKDNRNLLIEKIERNQESPRYIRLTARP
ncbi:hypothetical protein MKQ70_14110 [Chitinophaga sedimenti]|uniref:hypothetical protein n=1 Tax=Chitinophaga sedimenti TaxID=2033606 RepID=UPI002002AF41|nr:hypothetical protein [Chitinophaga sedimenti]MCK7556091.1 hypothetical protein [Chitinophaga sedimenti]